MSVGRPGLFAVVMMMALHSFPIATADSEITARLLRSSSSSLNDNKSPRADKPHSQATFNEVTRRRKRDVIDNDDVTQNANDIIDYYDFDLSDEPTVCRKS